MPFLGFYFYFSLISLLNSNINHKIACCFILPVKFFVFFKELLGFIFFFYLSRFSFPFANVTSQKLLVFKLHDIQ